MAVRTLTMCDRKEDANEQTCSTAAVGKCVVCNGDFCARHTYNDFTVRVEAEKVFGFADIGPICKQCAYVDATAGTRQAIAALLAPLRDQIAEILRAQQTAEALK